MHRHEAGVRRMKNLVVKLLRNHTGLVLRTLESKDAPNEAVNWASLRCIEAWCLVTDSGEERYGVTIEEASPDATQLQELVRQRLKENGWRDDIEVRTEW